MRIQRCMNGRRLIVAAVALACTFSASTASAQISDWTFEVGFLMLRHEHNDVPVIQGTTVPQTLRANDHDFNFDPGWEIGVAIPIADAGRVVGRYQQITWNSDVSVGFDVPSVITPNSVLLTETPSTSAAPLKGAQSGYRSELKSFELLWSEDAYSEISSELNISGGFRWLNLDERFSNGLNYVGPSGFLAAMDQNSSNDMYGFQLGLDGSHELSNGTVIDAWGKAGVYYNTAKSEVSYRDFTADANNRAAADKRNITSYAFEAGAGVTHYIRRHWWLRLGYRVMFLENVAMAPDQLSRTTRFNLPTVTTDTDTNGLLIHGADINMILSY